jgi:hypothetical protein
LEARQLQEGRKLLGGTAGREEIAESKGLAGRGGGKIKNKGMLQEGNLCV